MEALTLEPLASSEAVLTTEEKEAGVAIVDIGGGTTDIAIFKDNIIRHNLRSFLMVAELSQMILKKAVLL